MYTTALALIGLILISLVLVIGTQESFVWVQAEVTRE